MNIALIGYRGTGKTTVSKLLADELGYKLLSTDALIVEHANMGISELVKKSGWEKFRAIEKEVISEIAEFDDCVFDCGGGIVEDWENIAALKKNKTTKIILLTANINIIAERIQGSDRPSLTSKSIVNEIEEVLNKRRKLYEKAADVKIDTSKLTVQEIVKKIRKQLRL
ncbi:TPA: shikimate kinase [Candidatus Woesearchaeota archaeon]|nr:shikimate kinase [Candidatus Woesearchaeota archaeon]